MRPGLHTVGDMTLAGVFVGRTTLYRRALAVEVPGLVAVGWRVAAWDRTPSVGAVALLERDAGGGADGR